MEKGGRTKRIAEGYRGLRDLGHDVRLVMFAEPPAWVRERHDSENEWVVLPKSEAAVDFALLRRLLGLVRDFKPELIDTHCEASALYAGLVGRYAGVPCVATIHRSKLSYYEGSWKSRLYFRFVKQIVAVSEQRKQLICKALALPDSRVEVVHWGISLEHGDSLPDRGKAREELGLGPGPVLLSVGHLDEIKGHDDSISAMVRVLEEHPQARLFIAGDGNEDDYRRLREHAEKEGVEEAVTLLGQTSNIYDWLRACDVFLQPSREEAFGLVFLEAGLCERPTVATRVGGIPEVVEEGTTGLLVAPEDPGQVAAALLELLAAPERAQQMGEAARHRVREKFSLPDRVRALSDFFQHVAKAA